MKYIEKQTTVDALQLRWDNWQTMCEFVQVGTLTDGRPEGCYVNKNNEYVDAYPGPDALIGMRVPTQLGVSPARQGDMIVKYSSGMLDVFPASDFYKKYELWPSDDPKSLRGPPEAYHGPYPDITTIALEGTANANKAWKDPEEPK